MKRNQRNERKRNDTTTKLKRNETKRTKLNEKREWVNLWEGREAPPVGRFAGPQRSDKKEIILKKNRGGMRYILMQKKMTNE